MKEILLSVFTIITISSCAQKSGSIKIKQFIPVNDSTSNANPKDVDKIEYFIVSGYKDNDRFNKEIENFAKNKKNPFWSDYKSYQMMFYKESENTNETSLKKDPRMLDRYSQDNDWIFLYSWYGKISIGRNKVLNGRFIDPPSSIKIED